MIKRALILGCSATKLTYETEAFNLYNGPLWRIVRKNRPHSDLFAFSAKYGLIPAQQVIAPYNARINKREWTDEELIQQWVDLKMSSYDEVYYLMGARYANALLKPLRRLHSVDEYLFGKNRLEEILDGFSGPIGIMGRELKKYTHRQPLLGPVPEWIEIIRKQ